MKSPKVTPPNPTKIDSAPAQITSPVSAPITDPEAANIVTALGMTRTKEGWSVVQYKVQGRTVIEAELLGDDPAMSKARADDLIRVEVARQFLFQMGGD